MYRFLLIFSLFFIVLACQEKALNRIEGNEICIYFEDKSDFELAKNLASFWKERNFTGKKKQYLKLSHEQNSYYLFLIAKDEKYVKNLSFEERKMLIDLQKNIDSLLPPKNYCNIILSDSNFNPLLNVND